MALIGSRSSFVLSAYDKSSHCSECLKKITAGTIALVSYRHGRVVKRICSDECRETFDDRFWQELADDRQVDTTPDPCIGRPGD